MKPMMKILVGFLLMVPLAAQEIFQGCPMEGDAKRPEVRALNRLKNRYSAVTPPSINPHITLQALMAPGVDRSRWKVHDGAEVVGYVRDVKVGGIETVNCHARSPEDRDTHIELVTEPLNFAQLPVIVEVTPRVRALMAQQGVDWSTDAIRTQFKGRWVKVRGWMLLDVEHLGESENTAPGRLRNWRQTAWEPGHPVTYIEVINPPR